MSSSSIIIRFSRDSELMIGYPTGTFSLAIIICLIFLMKATRSRVPNIMIDITKIFCNLTRILFNSFS